MCAAGSGYCRICLCDKVHLEKQRTRNSFSFSVSPTPSIDIMPVDNREVCIQFNFFVTEHVMEVDFVCKGNKLIAQELVMTYLLLVLLNMQQQMEHKV